MGSEGRYFTRGGMKRYGLVHMEYREHHARALQHGIAMLPDDFVCEVCWCCRGEGYRGHPHYEGCRYCEGSGLTQGSANAPASDSQRHQVLVAASRSLLLDFDVLVI